VFYELYFLSPQFCFVPKLVHVVWEKTKMVLPSNFSSKTNVQPRHATGVGVHARHVPVAHLSADMATIFIIILMISYIYIYLGGCHPQCTISDTYSNYRGWIMKFIKPQGNIWEKKLCLSNKHLVIFWVISIGHAYNFVFPIVTHDWLCFVLSFFF
jgi:hypothetical protein